MRELIKQVTFMAVHELRQDRDGFVDLGVRSGATKEGAELEALQPVDKMCSTLRPVVLLELHNPECDAMAWEFQSEVSLQVLFLEPPPNDHDQERHRRHAALHAGRDAVGRLLELVTKSGV